MKAVFCLALFLFGSSVASAQSALRFNCEVQFNIKKVYEATVDLAAPGDKKVFFTSPQYEIKLSRDTQSEYTLEIYDIIRPSRTYAKGNVHVISDGVSLVIWEREGIIEVGCQVRAAKR